MSTFRSRRRRLKPTADGQLRIGDDLCERRLALWALRMARNTDFMRTLSLRHDAADELLPLIGPWVEWPQSLREEFISHLDRLASNPLADLDLTEKTMPPAVVNRIPGRMDWTAVNWRSLAQPYCRFYRSYPETIHEALGRSLKRLEAVLAEAPADALANNVRMLAGLLKLSATEEHLLMLFATAPASTDMRSLLRTVPFRNLRQAGAFLSEVLGVPAADVIKALGRQGPLLSNCLVNDYSQAVDLEDLVQIEARWQQVLHDAHDTVEELVANFLEESAPGHLKASDYPHLDAVLCDLMRLLKAALAQGQSGVNILLYGVPGSGKTEFARLLAAEAGVRLYSVRTEGRDGDGLEASTQDRLLGYQLAQGFLAKSANALVLFDEVEAVFESAHAGWHTMDGPFGEPLPGGRQRKPWLNQVLESNPVPTIWIANHIDAFDKAFLRRFLYSVEFRIPPRSVRRRIVERHLGSLAVSPEGRDRLAGEAVSPAQLDQVAKAVRLILPGGTAEETEAVLFRTLGGYMTALGQSRAPVSTNVMAYSLDYLNIDSRIPVERLISGVERTGRMSLCLAGPPGTGKSQQVAAGALYGGSFAAPADCAPGFGSAGAVAGGYGGESGADVS